MSTALTTEADTDGNAATDVAVVAVPTPSHKWRKLLMLGIPLVVAGLGAGLWFTGVLPRLLGLAHDVPKVAGAASTTPLFIELPEMVANLNGNPRRPSYVKVIARLEVGSSEDVERVKLAMPRLQDLFQTYLREMHPEELSGAGGTYRLREELMVRASVAAAPTRVRDVLFTELLIQ